MKQSPHQSLPPKSLDKLMATVIKNVTTAHQLYRRTGYNVDMQEYNYTGDTKRYQDCLLRGLLRVIKK
jgi:hypothetical protein